MPIHTELPKKNVGERNLARQLQALDDNLLHQFYSLEYVPGVTDIDVLLWDELSGVFCIEVKAVPMAAVLQFSYQSCEISGRGLGISPQLQAYEALVKLMQFARPKGVALPFMVATACWPLITRYEWNNSWGGDVAGEFAQRMIFAEDIEGGIDALRERLAYIFAKPPLRKGSYQGFKHRPAEFEAVKTLLKGQGTRRAAPSELDRLRQLENQHRKDAERDVPRGLGTQLLYSGMPGTGKTFRLLRIGINHALNGGKVIYFCFNKVLAADINRLLSFSDLLGERRPKVYDVFEFLKLFAHSIDVNGEDVPEIGKEYDLWASMLVEEMKARRAKLPKYDTVLIDEAQDLKDWALEMCELYATDDASMVIAAGSGQELYGPGSSWLQSFGEKNEKKNLPRNFRNTKPVFQLAQCAFEAALDESRIAAYVERVRSRGKAKSAQLEFERSEGRQPSVVYIDDTIDYDGDEITEACLRSEKLEQEAALVLRSIIDGLEEQQRLIDVLVLVPSEKRGEYTHVRNALLAEKIPFVDYVQNANRRDAADIDSIRLCTFHSSRGLEGQRVIVFGFEGMKRFAKLVNTPVEKLSYVVLSRATIDLYIVSQPAVRDDSIAFLQKALAALGPKTPTA